MVVCVAVKPRLTAAVSVWTGKPFFSSLSDRQNGLHIDMVSDNWSSDLHGDVLNHMHDNARVRGFRLLLFFLSFSFYLALSSSLSLSYHFLYLGLSYCCVTFSVAHIHTHTHLCMCLSLRGEGWPGWQNDALVTAANTMLSAYLFVN